MQLVWVPVQKEYNGIWQKQRIELLHVYIAVSRTTHISAFGYAGRV